MVREVAVSRKARRATEMIMLLALLALGVRASVASAAPLSMMFTEDRANVGVQLSDEALFKAPDTAPFEAQIDPGSGSITGGVLQVPQFSTHITVPSTPTSPSISISGSSAGASTRRPAR
jgi:hypothetical protein